MKRIGLSLLILCALSWAASAPTANAKSCSSKSVTQTQTVGIDHPDIPNCVAHPAQPYPNGICENVAVFTTTTGFTDCRAD